MLERDFFILQLLNETVAKIEAQPIKIIWQDKNLRQRSYVPDARVDYTDGSTKIFEVKPMSALKRQAAELAPKFAAAKDYAKQQGWEFCVVTEDDIRTPRLENSKFLYPIASEPTNPHHAACLFHTLRRSKDGKASVTVLLENTAETEEEKSKVLRSLWQLLAKRKLLANLDKKLDWDTILRLNENAWIVLQT